MAGEDDRNDIWEPDDAEVEQWLEEWAEVDASAVEYLDEMMRAIGWEPVPGPEMDRVAALLRAGAASGAPDYQYFVAALGGQGSLPTSDRDLWVEAAASTISPPEDPGDDIESQAVIGALQHADWLGLVLGLVRRGVGAVPDAEEVVEDIEALEGLEGDIEDRDGLVSVLEDAIEVLVPRWRVLGILDEDDGLTRLGRWGLPVALGESWLESRPERAVDEELQAAAMQLLAKKPRDVEQLRTALAKDHRIVDGDELYRTVISDENSWELPDGTLAHLPSLLEGLVLTHQLTAAEIEHEALDGGADLAPFVFLAEEGMPLRGRGRLVVRDRAHGYDVPGPGTSALVGPAGWLDEFQPGDVVALRYSRAEVVLEPASFPSDPDGDEKYANALVLIIRTAMTLARTEAAEDDPYGVWFPDLVASLRRAHPKILSRAHPPLGQLIAGVGLEVSGTFFGLPGTPWHGEPAWFDDRERATWLAWVNAVGVAGTDHPAGQEELADLAESLAESELVLFVASGLYDTPPHVQLVAAMRDAVSGTLAAVPLLLEARLAELRGDAPGMLALVEQAVDADPTNLEAALELGDLRSVAGDAADADRLYRVAGLDPLTDEVVLVRRYLAPPADGPARNKPCPCGSGKKYKLCHGRQASHALRDRAPWLWRKIQMFVQRGPSLAELHDWAGILAGAEPDTREAAAAAKSHPSASDFATFDGGLLDQFLAVWGQLLPSDELELAQSWRSAPRRLMEVEEVQPFRGLRVRDLVSGESLEILDKTMSRSTSVKDVLLGRPLPDGEGALRMQADPLRLPRLMRGPLLALMRADADGEQIAAFLAPRAAPEIRTTDGDELVDSTARYVLGDADRVWAELATRHDEDAQGDLVVVGERDVVRGHLKREGDTIALHAMSLERLRSLQEAVTEFDPSAVLVNVSTVPFDPASEPVSRPATPDAQAPPELTADDIDQIARRVEKRWLDQEIPALGGMTPQDAAAGDRREDLLALLDDFEWTQREHPQPIQMDIDRLRRELGLA